MRKKADRIKREIIKYASKEAERYMEKYVPFRDGHLRSVVDVGDYYVEYRMPYARYQYYGVSHSGMPLNYKTPGTGSHWDKRMMTAEGVDYIKQIQKYVERL